MIVLDTSAAMDGYFVEGLWDSFTQTLRSGTVLVPQHFDAECLSALRRLDMRVRLREAEAKAFVSFLSALPLLRIPTLKLADAIWAKRHGMTAYDAAYVALAESTDATLVTHDARLARSASSVVKVRPLG